jgi:NADH-quinone oxidoreductase subunit A
MQSFHSYECGFDPYDNIHYRYDIRFYVIALLFLLFDIEIVYLYPIIYLLNFYTYIYSLIFLTILTVGLIYEYRYSKISVV